jgi:hypothetical protein
MITASSTTTIPAGPTGDAALEACRWYLLRLNVLGEPREFYERRIQADC